MGKPDIIIVEDNDTMRIGISESLRREGYSVREFSNGPDSLDYMKNQQISLAVVDLQMEPVNGIEVLRRIKEINCNTEVLMISAYGTVDTAVESMKLGAADFLTKPFSPDELRIRIERLSQKILSRKELENLIEQNRILSDEISLAYSEIIGNSPPIREIFNLINKVAESDSPVLIQGESGTGKELIARAIYKNSRRANQPFIKINCGALNENLLESELFGHEKGAFTGAIRQKKGRFELADRGTLFLDEIGDISPAMQVKLLRVLQEGEFERVGGEHTLRTDVRIISATNHDLNKSIRELKFREDLFYRLSVLPVKVPPLRERKEDIPHLVKHFLRSLAVKYSRPEKNIDQAGMDLLCGYSWPGNIRELENLMERLYFISADDKIREDVILKNLFAESGNHTAYENLPLEEALYNFEKGLILQAMKKSNGVKNKAAKILGINTSALYYKLDKFGLLE